jgi:hypothetical protein
MSRYINITNKRFGKLTVLGFHSVNKDRSALWLCKCDCGREKIVRGTHLRRGTVQSCCCLLKNTGINNKNYKGIEEISGAYLYTILDSAKRRKISFNLTKEYLWDLFLRQNKKCILSGLEIEFSLDAKSSTNRTASLDRINNKKGYIEGNVQWVHKRINEMKWDKTDQEFIDLCKTVANYNLFKN